MDERSGVSLGRRLRAERGRQGLSMRELTAKSGVPPTAISEIERGVRKRPRVTTLAKLAKALDIPVEDLLEEEAVVA